MIDKTNPKYKELIKYSDPLEVQKRAFERFGKDKGELWISSRKDKKYMIFDGKKFVHFGGFNPPMEDYTNHHNSVRKENYIRRASNIKGNWKDNPFSPNNLSINLLW